mmetsp:Transcript_21607/g.60145  ORF Transcript_21607/g.60145 Transcript_21607/m.60145 type:complete len:509 (-) Transcript_21607:64-1590(-)
MGTDTTKSSQTNIITMESIKDLLRHELRPFLEVAIPSMLLQIGPVFTPFATASCIGRRFGSVYLSGFTLANLTGNLCSLSLLVGLYSASDTLAPQAFGAGNYKEVGLLCMRGFLASIVLLAIVNVPLVFHMRPLLETLGQDHDTAMYASQWYSIFAISLPFFSLYNAIWKFLAAQNIMMPTLCSCLISCLIILPITLILFTEWYGFIGSAYAFLVFQISQAMILVFIVWWKQPHELRTWPGLRCWRELLNYERFVEYVSLGAGGMLAQSEWVYWEALGLIVGMLGVIPLSVHTIPTQIIFALSMCPFGTGMALSIRMGVLLPINVQRAKLLVAVTMTIATVCYFITSVLVYIFRFELFSIFTTEQEVIDGADEIWVKVCGYGFFLMVFLCSNGIANGLGLQWTLGAINFFFLWVIGLPVTYYETIVRGQGLSATWTWIVVPYFGILVSLFAAFMRKDWDAFSLEIQQREGMEGGDADADDSVGAVGDDASEAKQDDGECNERTHLLMA